MTPAETSRGPASLAQRDGLQAALAAAGTGTWRWDIATGIVDWDQTLEALCGLEPGAFGRSYEAWLESLHADERDDILALVQDALDRCSPYQFEHRTIWPDGTVRWLECRGEVVTDDDGAPAGTVGCAVDITARKRAELEQAALFDEVRGAAERLSRLQRISQRLARSLTVDDVIAAAMETLDAPRGASTRGLWLADDTTEALELAAQVGMKPQAAEMFRQIPRDSELPGAVAIRERRTVVSPSQDDSVERFPNMQDAPRTSQGFVAVPLIVEEEALGVLAFGYDGPLEEADVAFLEAATGTIAQTLQRVRLAGALERRSDEIAFLADITRAAITANDHRDLMRAIAATVVARLGDLCTIQFIPESGGAVETVVAHADPGRPAWGKELARAFALEAGDAHGIARVLRTGHPEVLTEFHDALGGGGAGPANANDPETRRSIAEDLSSAITVPIRSQGGVIGALQILAAKARPRDGQRDVALAQAVASGIGDALHSRWLTDQHRQISATLQRAFLPPTLPTISGIDVAAAYWPAGAASEVGGDFYDLFTIGDDRWAILIGDACGTGADAAATAAIARHTARAAARHGLGPEAVLEWVNQAVQHSDRNLFCTACYATMRTGSADGTVSIEVALGGHPLPVVVRAGGAELIGAPGTLLGVFDDPRFEVARTTLAIGDALVFYTDGMTDLPPPGDRTEAELQTLLATQSSASAVDILQHLREDLNDRVSVQSRADDVALLVIRNTGATR